MIKLAKGVKRPGGPLLKPFRHRFVIVCILASTLMTACGLPGSPSVRLEAPSSPGQTACEEYAQSFVGTTRDGLTSELEVVRAKLTSQSQSDPSTTDLLRAFDDVLVILSGGTYESFLTANDRVIRVCSDVGVKITVQ